MDCGKRYFGQMGRCFRIRFKVHFSSYKQQNYNSKFAQHLLESHYSMAPIDDVMEVVQVVKKGHLINALEKFYVYKETSMNNH
jgi:hypothetical protein